MGSHAIELLGWAATTVFVGSYFGKDQSSLRKIQMFGALLWVIYGAVIHAAPVVAANVLVLCAAAWSEVRATRTKCLPAP